MEKLLSIDGNWYKGNLHMHTTRSDGRMNPKNAIEIYRKHGYDFVAVTDHRNPGQTIEPHQKGMLGEDEIDSKEMLILSGVEWDTGGGNSQLEDDVPTYHILGVGMTDADTSTFKEIRHPAPQEMIDHILKHNGIAILAHPNWSVMDPSSIDDLHGFTAAEIYNAVSDLPWNGERADSSTWFDIWATHHNLCMPAVAGDDVHAYSGDECRSFTMVNAKDLSRDSILEAIKQGNFYCSQGPLIQEINRTDDQCIEIVCSKDVQTAVFYTNFIYSKDRVKHVENGHVKYPISIKDKFVRVELITIDGRKAWTSPYPVR